MALGDKYPEWATASEFLYGYTFWVKQWGQIVAPEWDPCFRSYKIMKEWRLVWKAQTYVLSWGRRDVSFLWWVAAVVFLCPADKVKDRLLPFTQNKVWIAQLWEILRLELGFKVPGSFVVSIATVRRENITVRTAPFLDFWISWLIMFLDLTMCFFYMSMCVTFLSSEFLAFSS